MPAASTSTPSSGSGGSDAGAIAGGVVGGLAAIAIITFLVWWFVIRKRRQAQAAQQKSAAGSARHERSRSMQSIASTVLTRASNVIQIAYIPGVTNRSAPETPGTLVPPVPPIPSTHASSASSDQYLFTPGDLRDSRYSNATSDRRSIATSLARSSVATTIYRNDAIVMPIPAQQARAGKAAVVSVKQGNGMSSDSLPLNIIEAPAVPAITEAQLQKAGKMKPQLSSIVARSVVARPVNVKGSKPKVPTVTEEETPEDDSGSAASHSRAKRFNNQNSKFDDSSDDESDEEEVNEKGKSAEGAVNSIQIGITSEGPFSDAHSAGTPSAPSISTEAAVTSRASPDGTNNSTQGQRTSVGSSRMLESTISQDDVSKRSQSPFDDQHEVK